MQVWRKPGAGRRQKRHHCLTHCGLLLLSRSTVWRVPPLPKGSAASTPARSAHKRNWGARAAGNGSKILSCNPDDHKQVEGIQHSHMQLQHNWRKQKKKAGTSPQELDTIHRIHSPNSSFIFIYIYM